MNRDDGDAPLSRRTCLRLLGTTAATAALAGCSDDPDVTKTTQPTRSTTSDGTPGPDTTEADPTDLKQYELGFDQVVNLESKGADTNGEEPINGLLDEHVADRTLIYLPPGRYRMDRGLELASFTNVGIVGKDATLVPPGGDNKFMFVFGKSSGGSAKGLLVQGLTFDVRGDGVGPFVLNVLVDDRVFVRDIAVKGKQDANQPVLGMAITRKGGTGVVERARFPDGGTAGTTPVGIFVHKTHLGEVAFRNCRVENFPNNGIYASRAKGPVKVEGGRFRNNDISQVRLASEGSYAKNVDIVVDDFRKGDRNQRAIWLRNPNGVLIQNCRVRLDKSVGASAVEVYSGGAATIRDTSVEVNASRRAFRIQEADPELDGNLTLENVSITGSATGRNFAHTIECLRDDVVFRDVTMNQSGEGRHGLWIRGKNCVVDGGEWVTSQRPISVSLTPVGDNDCLAHIGGIQRLRALGVEDPGKSLDLSPHGGAGFLPNLAGKAQANYCVGGAFVSRVLERTGQFMVVINRLNSSGAVGRIVPQ